jgi:hypothetical protein
MSAEQDLAQLRAAVDALERRVSELEAFPGALLEAFQNGLAEPFGLQEPPGVSGNGQACLTAGGSDARPATLGDGT